MGQDSVQTKNPIDESNTRNLLVIIKKDDETTLESDNTEDFIYRTIIQRKIIFLLKS